MRLTMDMNQDQLFSTCTTPDAMESHPRTNISIATSSQDIWYKPPLTATQNSPYVVYMLPGNPCIMTYYQPFLSTLFTLLNEALAPLHFAAHVGGYTPPGFRLLPGPIDGVALPASLQAQIGYAEQLIEGAVNKHVLSENGSANTIRPKVILVAHSIGTYMTLEILRRYKDGHNRLSQIDIIGAVLLCPTVVNITGSKNDEKANVCYLFNNHLYHRLITVQFFTRISAFPTLLGALVKILTFMIPLSVIAWIARVFARVPAHVAQAFAEFLKGPCAVQQTLHLLGDSCRDIKEDTWTENLWGSPDPLKNKAVPLKFYFAENVSRISSLY
jgi:pimeloyl-ACP methyl ester carboxylesterase